MQPKILAIIPCLNEAQSIGGVLEEFRSLGFPCDTLVVDDGSVDATAEVAARWGKVLRFERNEGISFVIRQGIGYALGQGYDFCIQIDGDGQHIPAQIRTLLDAYKKTPANLTIGCRYTELMQMFVGSRRIAAFIISCLLFALFTRRWLWDTTSGMRMMDRRAMGFFYAHLMPGQPDAVMIAQALRGGISIQEVPVLMRPRTKGRSSISGWRGICFFLNVLRFIFRIRFGKTP